MKQEGLVSNYTIAQYKPYVPTYNEDKVGSVLERKSQEYPKHCVIISDLTYVRVGKRWNYICVLVDLFNREIIGYCAGKIKDLNLVMQAFSKVTIYLKQI